MIFLRRCFYRMWDSKVKMFSLALILLLAFFDYAAMKNLFTNLQVSDNPLFIGGIVNNGVAQNFRGYISEVNVYPLMMVILLEGIPYFLGMEVSIILDKTSYRTNSKKFAQVGAIIALVALIGTFALVIIMRLLVIDLEVGFPKFLGGSAEVTPSFIVQFGLLFTPILTSLLAFVASLATFKSESAEELERKIDHLHKKFLNEQSKFYDILNRNDDARTALWTSLTSDQSGKMPSRFDDFRKECFDRIRRKLVENVIFQYPGQISRFNTEIEGILESYINQMSDAKETNVPYEILSITTENLFKQYDYLQKAEKNDIDAWNYTVAGEALEEELKQVLDNAVVVAQFKTIQRPYYMEGDF